MHKRVRPRAAKASRRPVRQSTPDRKPAAKAVPGVRAAAPATVVDAVERPVVAADAVRAFQTAMEALQRHRYADAATAFRGLIDRFPDERALLDRARVYLDLCERELRKRPAEPQTAEERLTAATAALNNGDDDQAESLAKAVLTNYPNHDLALYLLATVEARRGNVDEAISNLRQAISISPEVSAQARHDDDFEVLRDSAVFRELTEAPPINPRRAARRGRGER